ncbi:MAG: hypothetical protein M1820_005493 [Bogoriella megaspora]|nr:MAG: hypothetical protein M1820_005493 [Bogoriella megaspora]
MAEKRPFDRVGGDTPDPKRSRSTDASPAAAVNGSAQKTDLQKKIEEIRAKAAALKRKDVSKSGTGSLQPTTERPMTPGEKGKAGQEDPGARARALRAQMEAKKAQLAAKEAAANLAQQTPSVNDQTSSSDDPPQRRIMFGNQPLHPLLGQSVEDAKSMSKQAQEKEKQKKKPLDLSGPNMEEVKSNPYYDPSLGGAPSAKARPARKLNFNQQGKYITQANALRRQAELEEMKIRIAESARKADRDDENEKAFLVEEPPEVEWWDEGLVNGSSYAAINDPSNMKLSGPDSIVSKLVQHPVFIDPPQEKLAVTVRPMYLTQKELAKLRRQRRGAAHKEEQAKIRLGLVPPPPPKVKKSNLMRVLGEQAVKDPTAVEMRVTREIADRAAAHENANKERKKTKEQSHAKLAENQGKDAAKGIYCAVFKIDSLVYGKHRYQIDQNAKQYALTGTVILHPNTNLVIAEGGEWSIKHYKKLMLNRMKWYENAAPPERDEEKGGKTKQREEEQPDWLKAVDDDGVVKDLSGNKCTLVFEGEVKARAFRKWGVRTCETDGEAKEMLQRNKMENMWALAKSVTW